jgi:hypothetical protein
MYSHLFMFYWNFCYILNLQKKVTYLKEYNTINGKYCGALFRKKRGKQNKKNS